MQNVGKNYFEIIVFLSRSENKIETGNVYSFDTELNYSIQSKKIAKTIIFFKNNTSNIRRQIVYNLRALLAITYRSIDLKMHET